MGLLDSADYERAARRGAVARARHGAGRHPQGRPGAEHLHLLDRIRAAHDGRRAAVLQRERTCSNFYSVSISGYHIAEAGANPVTQLAFTLANGFTIVEYYLARGMKIDDFAPNLSFFFSNGMDAEYAVIGRVARRIWARAMQRHLQGRPAQPDVEVPHPDVGPFAARARNPVQRHPHDAAGHVRAVRQLQFAAHQRLRRGADHAHAKRACGARWPSS